MKEKGIKAEDVKNLPPIEEIHGLNLPPAEEIYGLNSLPIEETHGLDNPTHVVKVNSLYRYDKAEIPPTKFASQCLDGFDNFMVKQEYFNAYVGRQLKQNTYNTWVIIYLELKVNLNSLVNMLLWLPLK